MEMWWGYIDRNGNSRLGGCSVNCVLLYSFTLFLSAVATAICGVEVRANDVDAMMRGAGQAFKKTFAEGFVRKPWMLLKTGQNYRLPSEAEGEYAARAGVKKRFWRLGEYGLCGGSFGDSSRLRYDSDVR
jgi:hypothetical protein